MRETAEKTTTETAYYLLSSALTPERFNEVARQHWGVENSLHWRLDVVINEDQDRTRMGHGPENLAILRPMPINTIKKRGLQRIAARKVQKRQLERERPLPALDAILYSDSLGNRPEFSPHRTKASSRRGRKSDARCSLGPPATGKSPKTLSQRTNLPRIARVTRCAGEFAKRLDCRRDFQVQLCWENR